MRATRDPRAHILPIFSEENLKHSKNEMHFRQVVLKLAKRFAVVHVNRSRCQKWVQGATSGLDFVPTSDT